MWMDGIGQRIVCRNMRIVEAFLLAGTGAVVRRNCDIGLSKDLTQREIED
jgi:hypothetical protein